MSYEEVLSRNFEWGLDALKKFIEIPTVNPPGEKYREFVDTASTILREAGFETKIYEVPREVVEKHYPDYKDYPRYILLAQYGEGRPVVHFNGHYDVVPPGTGWKTEPFKAVVEGGKVYGRGAVDMKGGIVAAIVAAKTFIETHRSFSGTVEIALVPDEEIGGETGTGYLLSAGLSRPDYVIIPEPSGSENIWIGHRGAFWFYVEVYGKQAHGSTPWLGVNAFEYMVKVAQRFMDDYRKVLERKKSSYTYDDPRGAVPTITVGGEVRGGAKINIVPGYMAFSVDRRVVVEEKLEDVEKEVREFVEKLRKEFPEVRIELKVATRLSPAITDPGSEIVKKLSTSVEKVIGKKPRLSVCLGGLDMRFYTEKGIQAVTYGPGPILLAHQANEHVELEELRRVSRAYLLFIESVLG